MNPIRQRIAIARACGHKDLDFRLVAEGTGMDEWVLCSGVIGKGGYEVPDYLNDHNAIQEAVNTLGLTLKTAYASNLFDICGSWAATVWATPEQKCKAFLKTIGKWEE